MKRAMMEISVVPVGTGSASVSDFVAGVLRIVQDSGLEFRLTPMGTVVQGPVDQLLRLAEKMHAKPFEMGAPRVVTTIKLDQRADADLSMDGKISSVQEKMK